MNKKICFLFSLAVIIGLSALVFTFVYNYELIPQIGKDDDSSYRKPTGLKTSDLVRYENKENGFEIKYPSKWKIDNSYYNEIIFLKVLEEGEKEEIMIISVEPLTDEEISDIYILSKEEITINEINWKKIHRAEQYTVSPEIVIFITERNNEFFIVGFNLLLESEENIQNIISTFKFLE